MTPMPWSAHQGHGALLTFEGIARPTENDEPIVALDYEAYEPMASNMMRRIGQRLEEELELMGLCVEHSIGRVHAGDRSLRLRIAAIHRKEALQAADRFIDELKRDVPIWKSPVRAGQG